MVAILTIQQLYANSVKVSASRAQPPSSAKIIFDKAVPYKGVKSVLFQFFHYGLTEKAIHRVQIFFVGLDILDEPTTDQRYFQVEYGGEKYWVEKPDVAKTDVRVRCSCQDFFFTFAWYNYQLNALYGSKPRAYQRKTKTRPPRNPQGLGGFCKHCNNSISTLQDNQYTRAKVKGF